MTSTETPHQDPTFANGTPIAADHLAMDNLSKTAPHEPTLPLPGIYRHFKGNLYEVYGLARHSETQETMVVYRPLYGNQDLWVRPIASFLSPASIDGNPVPRFALQDKTTPNPET